MFHDPNTYIKTKDTICENIRAGITVVFYAASLVIACPFACLAKGCDKIVECAYDYTNQKIHEKKLKEDWNYRFSHTSIKISTLKVWQNYTLDLDQYERGILQIAEANDIPCELWYILRNTKECSDYFEFMIRIYNTDEYIKKKQEVIQKAYEIYIQKYAMLHNITYEDAFQHVLQLIESTNQAFQTIPDKTKNIDIYIASIKEN